MREWKQDSAGNRTYYLYDGSEIPLPGFYDSTGTITALNNVGLTVFSAEPRGRRALSGTASTQLLRLRSTRQKYGQSGPTSSHSIVSNSSTTVRSAWMEPTTVISTLTTGSGRAVGLSQGLTRLLPVPTCITMRAALLFGGQLPSFGSLAIPSASAGGINLYEFAGNNPANRIDPSGLWNFYHWTYWRACLPAEVYDAAFCR